MSVDTSNGHPAMDYSEHVRTYSGFIRVGIILIIGVVIVLAYLLSLVP